MAWSGSGSGSQSNVYGTLAADPRVQQAGRDAAVDAFRSVDWSAKGRQAADVVLDAKEKLRRGNVSTQTFCFAGGVAMLVYAVLCFVNVFSVLDSPFRWVCNIYLAFFAIIIMSYECPVGPSAHRFQWVLTALQVQRVRRWFDEWFKAFSVLLGRGILYFSGGLLFLLGDGPLSVVGLLGLYLMCCGGYLIYQSVESGRSLDDARVRLQKAWAGNDSEKQRMAFQRHAPSGSLDHRGLRDLFQELTGKELSADEVQDAMTALDTNCSGTIEYEEFIAWYSQKQIELNEQEEEEARRRDAQSSVLRSHAQRGYDGDGGYGAHGDSGGYNSYGSGIRDYDQGPSGFQTYGA
eukprot:TRINITY_DN1538_c1_g1_i1.p1 TRINITY_DN1538_c1_g1~~TRINITY_DN1538_c1_g1_i1.p1  ORF type:complete len:380 (+),score=130.41 TRINITY_DN1538_c1_g1_i1:94-1140(+)